MRRFWFTPEQMIAVRKEHKEGASTSGQCLEHEISHAMLCIW